MHPFIHIPFTFDLGHIDWTATGVLITLITVLLQALFRLRRQDIHSITAAFKEEIGKIGKGLTALGEKMEKFEGRLLRLEEWRVTVESTLRESHEVHREIAGALTDIRDSTARLETMSSVQAKRRHR